MFVINQTTQFLKNNKKNNKNNRNNNKLKEDVGQEEQCYKHKIQIKFEKSTKKNQFKENNRNLKKDQQVVNLKQDKKKTINNFLNEFKLTNQ